MPRFVCVVVGSSTTRSPRGRSTTRSPRGRGRGQRGGVSSSQGCHTTVLLFSANICIIVCVYSQNVKCC